MSYVGDDKTETLISDNTRETNMSNENELDSDYRVLVMLLSLKHFQDAGNEQMFAEGLESVWEIFNRKIPDNVKMSQSFLVLAGYFQFHGNLGQFIREIQDRLIAAHGLETHESRMQKVRRTVETGNQLLSLMDRIAKR